MLGSRLATAKADECSRVTGHVDVMARYRSRLPSTKQLSVMSYNNSIIVLSCAFRGRPDSQLSARETHE